MDTAILHRLEVLANLRIALHKVAARQNAARSVEAARKYQAPPVWRFLKIDP